MPPFPAEPSNDIAIALGALPTKTPVSEVAGRLLDLFTGGSVAPGTRLPPERTLAGSLGIGRSAVREALAALEILGIVDVRPGSGTYLRGTASDLLPETLRWGLLIGKRKTVELLELREGLEIHVARLAAARRGTASVERLEYSARITHRAKDDLASFAHADMDFHQALSEAAGNRTLTDHLDLVRSLLRVYADRAVHDRRQAEQAMVEHDAVLSAVRAGDADAAASAMAAHMATATTRILAEI